ncbi:UNKNOWN [Stylonychia lemnae]|uniref:Mitochondrial carrier protein n=1 Tax=Stylonychia lemnae TaxID=5949 RepID=A0A078B727_STYLE|nr:UNKNOWN [Stylonychia lemnae]|eukprot:CDW89996.1 UNKNOWN [Stylonychia lemnae]
MQAQTEYFNQGGYTDTVKKIYRQEGFIGFYRGWIPPVIGSIVYRSSQFAIVDYTKGYFKDNQFMTTKIPFTAGLEPRVILGGFNAGLVRSVLECPFEYAKIKRQTGQAWEFKSIYKGFQVVCMKNAGLISTYFVVLDSFQRNTKLFETKIGQFIVSGTAACTAFWLIYPLDFLKSQIQSEAKGLGNSMRERAQYARQKHGFFGVYRGILAGSQCIFFRNGVAMLVMQQALKILKDMGFTD